MPMISTRAGPIFVARRGAHQPVVICLHGAGGSYRHWGLQLRELATHATLVAVDLPGHGRSPAPARSSIAAYAEVLLALIDALGLEHALLAGHSMGAAVALQAALDAPARVSGLFLVGAAARFPRARAILRLLKRAEAAPLYALSERLYAPGAPESLLEQSRAELRSIGRSVLVADFGACAAFDCSDRLPTIACQAIVAVGQADRVVPPYQAAALSAALPQSTYASIAGAGHMAMIEQPRAVVDLLRQAIEQVRDGQP